MVDLQRKMGAASPGRSIEEIKVFTKKGQVISRVIEQPKTNSTYSATETA